MINKIKIINDYIENELFNSLFIFHPVYSISGKLTKEMCSKVNNLGTEVIISIDRNVLSDVLIAAKSGCFDACKNKKETTAFLFWIIKNNYGIMPYDALKEQALVKSDNISGNKEFDIFDKFFNNIRIDKIIDAFFYDNIKFPATEYKKASEIERLDFLEYNSDFLFLYATILHLAYELRSEKEFDEQFEGMMKWFFKETLISATALTYCSLIFTKDGITRPHNYMNNNEIFHGCMNQAMDLYYFQEIDPRRYSKDNYTIMLATHDLVMKEIFTTTCDSNGINTIDDFIIKLCSNVSDKKRKKYTNIIMNEFKNHKPIDVNKDNAYEIAKSLCDKEETRLKSLLNIQ